jgi:hypothetical protein
VERVCELVRRHALQGSILFSSFLPGNLNKASQLLPEVPRGLLARPRWQGAGRDSHSPHYGAASAASDVSPQHKGTGWVGAARGW